MRARNDTEHARCDLCEGEFPTQIVSAESRQRDVSRDRWSLTEHGAAELAKYRAQQRADDVMLRYQYDSA